MRLNPALQPIDKLADKDATGWFVNNRPGTVLIYAWSLGPHAAKRPTVTRLGPQGRYFVREKLRHQLVWISGEPGTP